jgi:hypothetical protein
MTRRRGDRAEVADVRLAWALERSDPEREEAAPRSALGTYATRPRSRAVTHTL